MIAIAVIGDRSLREEVEIFVCFVFDSFVDRVAIFKLWFIACPSAFEQHSLCNMLAYCLIRSVQHCFLLFFTNILTALYLIRSVVIWLKFVS